VFRESGLSDSTWIGYLAKPLALGISKQMMNQEDGEELTEALVSALVEGFNNVLGAFDTALKEDFGVEVEHADLKFLEASTGDVITGESGVAADADTWRMPVTASFEGASGEMGFLITGECLTELAGKHPGIEEKMAEQPAEAEKIETPEPVEAAAVEAPKNVPAAQAAKPAASPVSTAHFEDLQPRQTSGASKGIELILDVPLSVTVELGRKSLSVREILELNPGSLVELEKLAGEAVDLLVNGKLFAKGEVVVIDENFGVRVSSIVTPKERLERMSQ
jgi:flagellar motor switch protein FliN/FliY